MNGAKLALRAVALLSFRMALAADGCISRADCFHNGHCNGGECVCDPGFMGDDCAYACPLICENGGYCEELGLFDSVDVHHEVYCACPDEYTGETCARLKPPRPPPPVGTNAPESSPTTSNDDPPEGTTNPSNDTEPDGSPDEPQSAPPPPAPSTSNDNPPTAAVLGAIAGAAMFGMLSAFLIGKWRRRLAQARADSAAPAVVKDVNTGEVTFQEEGNETPAEATGESA